MTRKSHQGIGVALLVLFLGTFSTIQAGRVGTYVCAVDNCRKHYLSQGEKPLDACTAGVQNALKSGPASAACLQMCDDSYPGTGSALNKACREGCSLFETACLRDGKIPPR